MAQYAYVYLNHTHLYNWSTPSCYFTKAALNGCYSEVTAYTALVLTLIGLVSTTRMDAYVMPMHYRYRLQLSYISHRTYLTNHIGSISHHITPLVINSLGGGHTHTSILSRTEATLQDWLHITWQGGGVLSFLYKPGGKKGTVPLKASIKSCCIYFCILYVLGEH